MIPERWLVLSVRSPSGEEESGILAEGLLALGGRAVWEEEGKLVTHLLPPDDATAFEREAVDRLRALTGMDALEVETGWQPHEDWAETWKRGLAPRRITERLVVTPSWEKPETRPGDVVVLVDPGMAFGNAEHGTTRGSLRLLDTALQRGDRVLDVGSGSGILSIAAALLGAREVVAVEGDPLAWETLDENLARNGVSERVRLHRGWATSQSIPPMGRFDGVTANIEAGVLEKLLPGIAAVVPTDGWVVLSGILEGELSSVVDHAQRLGLRSAAVDADGEWRSVLLRGPAERAMPEAVAALPPYRG